MATPIFWDGGTLDFTRFRPNRDGKVESCTGALGGVVLGPELSAVGLDDGSTDGKSHPEAIRDALANRLQRSVNILLGSVLASIGLTIPLVIAVSLSTGRMLILGLDSIDAVMLVLSLVTSMLTFSLPRTNVLLGCVHLLLFCAYIMLMFDR